MNYSESLKYLNSFVNLERLQNPAHKPAWNLERVRYLMKISGHPEKSFFPVIIAGTKGKGSTGFFLESILEASGVPSGFYSSPHLETPLERIRLGGRLITPSEWAKGLTEIRTLLRTRPLPERFGQLTYFEVMTFLAILVFARKRVRVGIFEAGMGGRLDAVNALDAQLSIITTIGLDHEAFLGDTIEKIAAEKAGIIRSGAFVIAAQKPAGALQVIRRKAAAAKARILMPAEIRGVRLGLRGDFQKLNAGLAVRAAELLSSEFGHRIPSAAVRGGLSASGWPGRMETVRRNPLVLLDGAHNPAAAEALTAALKSEFPRRAGGAVLVFGVSRDKKSGPMLGSLSRYFDTVVLTKSRVPRSQDVHILVEQARGRFRTVVPALDAAEALDLAQQIAGPQGMIVVTGSFYVVGEARKTLRSKGLS